MSENLIVEPNPLGHPKHIESIQEKVDSLIKTWEENKPTKSKLNIAINFVINSLDDLIKIIKSVETDGANKKATVISNIQTLYDKIIFPSFPLWLKPFAAVVEFIINIVVSVLIDFIVKKYKENNWSEGGGI